MIRTVQAKRTVVPIVRDSIEGSPYPVGSGVLLEYGGARWLVSAAHVLDVADHNTIYLPGKSGLVPIEGNFYKTEPPSSGRRDDLRDLGFVGVDDIASLISSDYQFLPEELISLDGETEEGRNYLFLGYPHKSVKIRKDLNKIRTQAHSYEAKGIEDGRYSRLGIDPKTHIAITFDPKRAKNSDGRIETPKDQQGTSGGGAWMGVLNYNDEAILIPKLVGIIIEQRITEKVLIASRILPLLGHMKKLNERRGYLSGEEADHAC